MVQQTRVNAWNCALISAIAARYLPGKESGVFLQTAESDFVPLRIEVAKISGQKCGYTRGLTPL